jgi:hypothetical protein
MRTRPRSLDVLDGTGGSREQEDRIAKETGGRRVPGSGSSLYARGDVKTADYLIEAKQTEKDSIRVTWAWLAKITRQALAAGKRPALVIEVRCKEQRDVLVESEWAIVPLSDWKRLREQEGR